jgi:hypothetical protein
MVGEDLIHGSSISFQPENRATTGTYGTLLIGECLPVFQWPGLNTSFGINVEKAYEEVEYTPAHGNDHTLECIRNAQVAEELPFSLNVVPQVDGNWKLLEYITGDDEGFGDAPDSTSWMKELDGKFSVFTGVMPTDYKCDIPGKGVAKESIGGFAGHRAAISPTDPTVAGGGSHALEDTSRPIVWNDIVSVKMDENASPGTEIKHCLSDISFGFTSEIAVDVKPSSLLSTKICDVKVVSRKMFVSLKMAWIDQTFIDIVTTPVKQYLKLEVGASPHKLTATFGGLYWNVYEAKAEKKTLAGGTLTSIVDQPTLVYAIS